MLKYREYVVCCCVFFLILTIYAVNILIVMQKIKKETMKEDSIKRNSYIMAIFNKKKRIIEFKQVKKDAKRGDAQAQTKLGHALLNKDREKSLYWFKKAAHQGDPEAQYCLGAMFRDGKVVPQNYAEAVEWFTKAAEGGHRWGSYHLAVLYENGIGVPQNFAKAEEWYRKAAEQGNSYAKDALLRIGRLKPNN